MADIYDIKKRADELSAKWKTESIPPEEVGDLIRDLADYANQTEINGSSLGIRKTYATVSAMEADSNPVDDKDGTPLRRGMLVNIYNQDDASAPDNGKVFSWQNPGWQLRTKLDAGYATTEQVDAIDEKVDNIKPVVINGDVTNNADDEDLEAVIDPDSSKGVMKLKDRPYDPSAFSGKGYTILRKNVSALSRTGSANILTQEMINQPNTVYEIRYNFDLGGEAIVIPEGSILKFSGGIIRNGEIKGEIALEGTTFNIFENVILDEAKFNTVISPEWFRGNDTAKLQQAIRLQSIINKVIVLSPRVYEIDTTLTVEHPSINIFGYSNGGEFGESLFGESICTIKSSDKFESEYEGKPLMRIDGKPYFSLRLMGVNFLSKNKLHNGINFKAGTGPARPVYIDFCAFTGLDKALSVEDNQGYTNIGFIDIENNTFRGNRWNLFGYGDGQLMNVVFSKNIAEQCDGCINIGYNDFISESNDPVVKNVRSLVNSITIENNLLEGTEHCIYVATTHDVYINKNYFEMSDGKKQIIQVSTFKSGDTTAENGSGVKLQLKNNYGNEYIQVNIDGRCYIDTDVNIDYPDAYSVQNLSVLDKGIFNRGRVTKPFSSSYFVNGISPTITGASNELVFNSISKSIIGNIRYTDLQITGGNQVYSNTVFFEGEFNEGDTIIINYGCLNHLVIPKSTRFALASRDGTDWMTSTSYGNCISDNMTFAYTMKASATKIYMVYRFYANSEDTSSYMVKLKEPCIYVIKKGEDLSLLEKYQIIPISVSASSFDKQSYMPNHSYTGHSIYDKKGKKPIWWDGENYRCFDGELHDVSRSGIFDNKPLLPAVGFSYFCKDRKTTEGNRNGIMIYYAGEGTWVDALGRVVE